MNVMHKLAWAAVLASSGVPVTQVARPDVAAPVPARPKLEPVAPPPAPAAPATPVTTEAWPLDLDDDEFEGEGWTFWPLAPRR